MTQPTPSQPTPSQPASCQPTPCQPTIIEAFLSGRLDDHAQASFESHLELCQDCRQRLVLASGTDEDWSQVIDCLRDEPADLIKLSSIDLQEVDSATHSNSYNVDSVIRWLTPSDDSQMLGRVGSYEVIGVVGFGGMGVVLKAFDPALRRVVAIKVMAPYLATCDAARKRFAREAQAAAAVTHDNVVDIFGVAESNGLPYLVMPYFKGYTLQKRLDENGKLPTLEILRIGYQLAAGLAAAHQQGLVHRDIKPANIMMQEGTERLVITDFGLARAVDDATVTRTSIVAGTPHYMSPEQARGETVDHRSDLFSLGTLLYLCCTSKLPFDAQSPYGILRKVTDAEPIAIRTLNNQIPTWIESIVVKLLSKPVESRYQSAQEVADLFAGCLNHLQQPNTSLPPSLIQKVPRRLLHGWLCTCALIIAIGSIVWLTMLGSKLDNATDTSSPHTTNQASIESSTTQQPQQITDEDELEWIDTESQQIYEEALRLEESLTLDSL